MDCSDIVQRIDQLLDRRLGHHVETHVSFANLFVWFAWSTLCFSAGAFVATAWALIADAPVEPESPPGTALVQMEPVPDDAKED